MDGKIEEGMEDEEIIPGDPLFKCQIQKRGKNKRRFALFCFFFPLYSKETFFGLVIANLNFRMSFSVNVVEALLREAARLRGIFHSVPRSTQEDTGENARRHS
jgi:hypothetical protein